MDSSFDAPPFIHPALRSPVRVSNLWIGLRYLLARNPFYILSALLLLYSMRLLSVDAKVFPTETSQLFFNFGAFQFYEVLLAGTAILLARRRVWYDSGLLVAVENLFVFVPFILVSQALLLSDRIAVALCATGCLLAAGRALALKRKLPNASLPGFLLVMGGLLLCLNVALPVVTRGLHANVNISIWDKRAALLAAGQWQWLMPLLMATALLLPASPRRSGEQHEAIYTRPWFPFLALVLWVAGTGAHLFCIGYVYGLPWREEFVLPTAWMAAWVLWLRQEDLDFVPQKWAHATERILLTLPVVLLALAESFGWQRLVGLCVITAFLYACVAVITKERIALHLACVSMVLALAGMPHGTAAPIHLHLPALKLAIGCLGVYAAIWALRSHKVGMGILGGIVVSALVWEFFGDDMANRYLAINLGFVFALLHSLRWSGQGLARQVMAIVWLGGCIFWQANESRMGDCGPLLSGTVVLAVYLGSRVVTGIWAARVIPVTSGIVAMLQPVQLGAVRCEHAPEGVLILAGSFVLFAIGTAMAMTKERWLARG